MVYDSIIIGSGLSGLSCALLLARSGRRVLVLEQHAQPGPVVRGFRRGGIYFDSGFHYVGGLGEGGAFRPLVAHLGLTDKLSLFPFAAQGFDCLSIAETGECFALPVGFSRIRAELKQKFPVVADEIDAYLNEVEQTWDAFPYLNLDLDIADFSIESVHGEALAERLRVFADYPQLQGLLSMHSFLYGLPASEVSTTRNAQVAGSYYHSVHGIVGGGKALLDAYLELLSAANVALRCSAEVAEILSEQGAITGVRLCDGEVLAAKEVVATLNPSLLPALLPAGTLRPAYRKRLENLRQTASAYVYFGQIAKPVEALQGCNLFVQPRAGLFGVEDEMPLAERGFYLAAADQGCRDGSCGIIGIVPASYAEVAEFSTGKRQRNSGYQQRKQLLGRQLEEMFSARCPELKDMQLLDLATPLTLRDYSSAPQGAIYGVGGFLGQYNPLPLTRLAGLYLSGQAIAAPGWLGTVVSAYLTCGSILGHQNLREEVKKCR